MNFLLQWLAVLILSGVCFVPARLGMQFTDYPVYMALTLLSALVTIFAMRLVGRAAPVASEHRDIDKEPQ